LKNLEYTEKTKSSQCANGISCTPPVAICSTSTLLNAREIRQKSFTSSDYLLTSKVYFSDFPEFYQESESVSSIDTLSVSLWLQWFHEDFNQVLELAVATARDLDLPCVSVPFGDQEWMVHRKAPKYFRYHLSSGDVHIFFSKHKEDSAIPNCKIEIGSLTCWSGTKTAYDSIITRITSHGCNVTKEIVSRVDLCSDFVGMDISKQKFHYQDRWIQYARTFASYFTNRKLNGVSIGKGERMLRIYDKVAELKQKNATNKQEAFQKIWGVQSYEEKPVTRVEFQFRREAIKEFSDENNLFQIDTVAELCEHLQSLWAYGSKIWARHNQDDVDRNNKHQSRAKLSKSWEKVCSVSFGDQYLVRTIKKTRKDIKALCQQMTGVALSLVAATGVQVDDYFNILSTAQRYLSEEIDDLINNKTADFYRKYKQRLSEGRFSIGDSPIIKNWAQCPEPIN